MGKVIHIVAVLLGILCGSLGNPARPLVDTKVGQIRGLPATDGDYSMYLGIPYATVDPSNPFGLSAPHTGFEDTFDAFDDSAVCPQREEFNNTVIGTLDCLNINVYVPNSASPENRLPVLVHIYGGGFIYGFGGRFQYEPKYLVKHDVIIVTFNYRLGAYGFLCLDTPQVPGNQGLKDQLTALRWIKNNIEAFGGDSDKITISGQSAGGISVDLHLMYTKEDLFRSVIMQSGTALNPFAIIDSDPSAALKLAERLGFKTDDTDDALEFLSTASTDYIVEATEGLIRTSPCVEKDFGNTDRFITDHPDNVDIITNAWRTPILIGFTSNELGPLYEDEEPDQIKKMRVFTQLGDYLDFEEQYAKRQEKLVRQFYIGDEEISDELKQPLVEFGGDFNFYHPIYRSIQKYIENRARTIYHYEFSYDGGRNFVKVKNNVTNIAGALHADELGYLFGIEILNKNTTPEDQLTIDRMSTMWTNFVKYSNPTPEITETLPVQWPSIKNKIPARKLECVLQKKQFIRCQPSIPHPGFESTFDAVDDTAVCPQWVDDLGVVGSLDCLKLNVYVPNTASSRNPVPVLVFIHGGGFTEGAGGRIALGPKFLVRHDVIVVTLNYRLGAYGFLCPDVPEVPGNQGLKDQLTALRWVKNNIQAFGGDINRITLSGESAGAVSVDMHLIYSQENLFNNVILQSGTAFTTFAINDQDPTGPLRMAAYLGFETDNINDAFGFLRTVDPTLIVVATGELDLNVYPCVESEYDNVERYISTHPVNADVSNIRTRPLLIGHNSNEQSMMANAVLSVWNPLARVADIFDFDNEYHQEMLTNIRQFYIGDEDVTDEVRQQITDFSSDFIYGYPTSRSIQNYIENRTPGIYHYMFSYDGGRNLLKRSFNITGVTGAVHADEMSYLYDVEVFPETPNPEDQLTIDRMTTLWTNFVKYSNPTPEVTDILPVQWPTVTSEDRFYLNIDSELSVQRRPYYARMAYWDLFFKLNRQFLKGYQDD